MPKEPLVTCENCLGTNWLVDSVSITTAGRPIVNGSRIQCVDCDFDIEIPENVPAE